MSQETKWALGLIAGVLVCIAFLPLVPLAMALGAVEE